MDIKSITNLCLSKFADKGIDKVSVEANKNSKLELQTEYDEIGLFRETEAITLGFRIIHNNKEASKSFTFSAEDGIDQEIEETITMAHDAQEDVAFSMAKNLTYNKTHGIDTPLIDKMHYLLKAFLEEKKEKYPEIKDTTNIGFEHNESYSINNQNVEFYHENGFYNILTIYTAVRGDKSSSMNYNFGTTIELPDSIFEFNEFEKHYQETIDQIDQREFNDKFVGDVILAPCELESALGNLLNELGGLELINKTSLFMDKIGQQIISDKITLKSTPDNPNLAMKSLFSKENYINKDGYLIKDGILKTFTIGDYVSKKTGLEPTYISSGCAEISAGDVALADMIKGIKKGILINRISSGAPNKNKDFAGVIKNSYYIEDGKIQYPIKEVMITANILEMLNNVEQVSKERLNTGYSNSPWVKCSNVSIAGK